MPRAKSSERRDFTAELRAPNNEILTYTVRAYTKTEARELVRRQYREDTPSARNGFYSFAQQRLRWVDED